jgi:hypothetical protein
MIMGAIVIKTGKKNIRMMLKLAKELGAEALLITDEQFEDLAMGKQMDVAKTRENVSKENILNKLKRLSGLRQG